MLIMLTHSAISCLHLMTTLIAVIKCHVSHKMKARNAWLYSHFQITTYNCQCIHNSIQLTSNAKLNYLSLILQKNTVIVSGATSFKSKIRIRFPKLESPHDWFKKYAVYNTSVYVPAPSTPYRKTNNTMTSDKWQGSFFDGSNKKQRNISASKHKNRAIGTKPPNMKKLK